MLHPFKIPVKKIRGTREGRPPVIKCALGDKPRNHNQIKGQEEKVNALKRRKQHGRPNPTLWKRQPRTENRGKTGKEEQRRERQSFWTKTARGEIDTLTTSSPEKEGGPMPTKRSQTTRGFGSIELNAKIEWEGRRSAPRTAREPSPKGNKRNGRDGIFNNARAERRKRTLRLYGRASKECNRRETDTAETADICSQKKKKMEKGEKEGMAGLR